MEKNNLQEELTILKQEEEALILKHGNKHFTSDSEGEKYISENKVDLQRLNVIQKRIKEIKWQLMSEQEKKEHLEYLQKLKEKYADD